MAFPLRFSEIDMRRHDPSDSFREEADAPPKAHIAKLFRAIKASVVRADARSKCFDGSPGKSCRHLTAERKIPANKGQPVRRKRKPDMQNQTRAAAILLMMNALMPI
jgi:hypothetical protein